MIVGLDEYGKPLDLLCEECTKSDKGNRAVNSSEGGILPTGGTGKTFHPQCSACNAYFNPMLVRPPGGGIPEYTEKGQ